MTNQCINKQAHTTQITAVAIAVEQLAFTDHPLPSVYHNPSGLCYHCWYYSPAGREYRLTSGPFDALMVEAIERRRGQSIELVIDGKVVDSRPVTPQERGMR